MRDNYEPPTQPGGPGGTGGPWEPFRSQPPARRRADPYDEFATRIDEMAGEARTAGLRRLSKLTWRSIQISALATVGFVTLFVRSAPAATVSTQVKATPSVKASTASPSPSPTKKKHKHPKPVSSSASGSAGSAGAAGTVPSAAPAPSPTLAPPTTAPAAPPPTPAPVQTTSSGSKGGG